VAIAWPVAAGARRQARPASRAAPAASLAKNGMA